MCLVQSYSLCIVFYCCLRLVQVLVGYSSVVVVTRVIIVQRYGFVVRIYGIMVFLHLVKGKGFTKVNLVGVLIEQGGLVVGIDGLLPFLLASQLLGFFQHLLSFLNLIKFLTLQFLLKLVDNSVDLVNFSL